MKERNDFDENSEEEINKSKSLVINENMKEKKIRNLKKIEDIKEGNLNKFPIKQRNRYTLKEKLSIIEIAEKNSNHYIQDTYGIDRKTVRKWRMQKNDIISTSNKNSYRLPGGGRKPLLTLEEESNVIN